MKANILPTLLFSTSILFAQGGSSDGGGGGLGGSPLDLPDYLPMLESADKLLDHALSQIESDGHAEIYIYGGAIEYKPGVTKAADQFSTAGMTLHEILTRMTSVTYRFPLLDPSIDHVTVRGVLYGPTITRGEQKGSRLALFEGSRTYKLVPRDGKWVVPDGAQKVDMYLTWRVPLALPLDADWAQVYLRDSEGGGNWQDVPVRNGQVQFPRSFAGGNVPFRIGYRRPDGTQGVKTYHLKTARVNNSPIVEPRHTVGLDSVIELSDDTLQADRMNIDIPVEAWRSFSPLIRLDLKKQREIFFRAATVEQLMSLDLAAEQGLIQELPYAMEIKFPDGRSGFFDWPSSILNGRVLTGSLVPLEPGKYSIFLKWKTRFQNNERFGPPESPGGKG